MIHYQEAESKNSVIFVFQKTDDSFAAGIFLVSMSLVQSRGLCLLLSCPIAISGINYLPFLLFGRAESVQGLLYCLGSE